MDKLPLESESGLIDQTESSSERSGSWAFQWALCLLGPLFFVSYMFTILAPLPFLYLHVGTSNTQRGRLWSAIGLALGLLLSFVIHGWLWGSLAFFLLAWLPAFVLGELLLRKIGPECAILGACFAVTLATSCSALLITRSQGLELIPTARQATEKLVRDGADYFLKQEKLPEEKAEELKLLKEKPGELFEELTGILAMLVLLLCTLPCIALMRWNPKGFLRRTGISRDYLRRWRSPDWFVWPSLLVGAFLLFEVPYLSDLAGNVLKPILLIYFFQGMSILAYFLDSLRLRGLFRVVFYGTAVLFLTPMVVSFGFFDLWFNFRGRNRPVDEEKEL